MTKSLYLKAVLPVLGLLCGCGGGGGGTAPPTSGTPGPTPTATVAAVRFAASATAPLLGTITFDLNGNGIADGGEPTAATDANGYAGQGVTGLYANSGAVPATASARLLALGADGATGFLASTLSAPAGATVVSPLTTIVDRVGDQATVRRAFELSAGSRLAIRDTTDLLQFDAAQRLTDSDAAVVGDARQITAINFRLLAMAQLLSSTQGDPVDVGSGAGGDGFGYIAAAIRDGVIVDFTQKAVVLNLLQRANAILRYQPEQADVIAEAVSEFMQAVPLGFTSRDSGFAYNLAYRFYLLANVRAVAAAYPSAQLARVRALTSQDMVAAVNRFANAPRAAVGAAAYALPDYVRIDAAATIPAATLLRNDVSGFPYGVSASGKAITSVALDSANSAQATVSLVNGDLRVEPVANFTGYLLVRYVARSQGLDTNGWVWVAVGQV